MRFREFHVPTEAIECEAQRTGLLIAVADPEPPVITQEWRVGTRHYRYPLGST